MKNVPAKMKIRQKRLKSCN